MARHFFVGDLHGNVNALRKVDEIATARNIDSIYQVGDMGVYWPDDPIKTLRYFTVERESGIPFFFILGNHDNYDAFNRLRTGKPEGIVPYYAKEEQIVAPLYALPRNHIMDDILALGGAVSSDASRRVEGLSWWREECPSVAEIDTFYSMIEDRKPSIIITHEAPDSVAPYRFTDRDVNPLSRLPVSCLRYNLEQVIRNIEHKPKWWFYGHHHVLEATEHNGTTFCCCGINGEGWILDTETDTLEIII